MSGIVQDLVLKVREVFNHERYEELYDKPPKTLKSINGGSFHVDPDVFRVYLQYVYNLVFKNLDILFLFGGEEGTGKSTYASQVGQQMHYIMVECNVLNEELNTYYPYTEKECMAHNFISFLKKSDKYNDNIFRILICDEAGGLKGEERWDEWNKKFRDEMRKDRKKLRVRILCYPQPFELVKDFTLARVNLIAMSEFRNDKKRGLIPDKVKMIIIPRGPKTFSCITREVISKKEIKAALLEQTKERYIKDLDDKYVFKVIRKDDVFCFDVDKYLENAKRENRLFINDKHLKLSPSEIKILANRLTPSKLGFSLNKNISELPDEERKEYEEQRREGLIIQKLKSKCVDIIRKNEEDL